MKISLGSDHRGFEVRKKIGRILESLGHQLRDNGTDSPSSVDYPDFAKLVAEQVADGQVDRGILVCGSGIGMSITANKIPGVRAALCHRESDAEMSRRHNNANVLCLSADLIETWPDEVPLKDLIKTWLQTEFDGGRHQRRVNKIDALDEASKCHEPR